MKTKRFTKPGFRETANRLGAIDRELRLEQLRNSGDITGHRVILDGKTKANDPRRQRKARSWERGE